MMKIASVLIPAVALVWTVGASAGDSRAAEKNYLGSPTYQAIEQDSSLKYLLQEQPTAAGGAAPARDQIARDSRYAERNYWGSSSYRAVGEEPTSLDDLLTQQPTAAGPASEPDPISRDTRYNYKHYLGAPRDKN